MVKFYPYRTRRKFYESGGINEDHTFVVRSEGIGKRHSDVSPYLLANEWIAGKIAQFLQLPIPAFTMVSKKSAATRMFVTHRFEKNASSFQIDPNQLCEAFQFICCGIVVFDIFVCNCDRQIRNIKVDRNKNPTALYIIDHERALFYVYPKDGINRLRSMTNRLGISDSHGSGGQDHCLVDCISDFQSFKDWVRRIQDIPNWFIDAVCEDVRQISITKKEADEAKKFLKTRRDNLWFLITSFRTRFKNLDYETWDLIV